MAYEIETVAKRSARYIQFEIDTKHRELEALKSYIEGLIKAKMLVEDVDDAIQREWEQQKKDDKNLDIPVTT